MQRATIALLCVALCATAVVRADGDGNWIVAQRSAADDRITSLPGLVQMPPFAMYSGYVSLPGTPQNLFYWFVESASNPSSDPLVLWMNGGPGCSSMLGLLTEHGPLRVQDDGKTLLPNPYAWNSAANIIYVEAPSGVGFSFGTANNYTTGDNDTATHNLQFVFSWMQKFPQFADNVFYVAGESYAGNYVPELSNLIMNSNTAGLNPHINFAGFITGNPTFDFDLIGNGLWPVMHYHALLSTEQYDNALATCNGTFAPAPNSACTALLSSLAKQFYGINPYDIEGQCVGDGPDPAGGCFTAQLAADRATARVLPPELWAESDDAAATGRVYESTAAGGVGQTFIPCIDVNGIYTYLNGPDVQTALHVSPNAVKPWDACSSVLHYTQYMDKLEWIYRKAVAQGFRVLVYSGDVDSCVPYLGTESCVTAIGLPVDANGQWASWTVVDAQNYTQIAGKRQIYADGALSYYTVRGAGHMVPHDRPLPAQALFTRFVSGEQP